MPAIIILGHFSPQIQAAHGFAGPELLHNVAAQFYDVPHIRQVLLVTTPSFTPLPLLLVPASPSLTFPSSLSLPHVRLPASDCRVAYWR